MAFIPAAIAALIPFKESSTTKHFSGGTFKVFDAKRKMSGEGLPFFTSDALNIWFSNLSSKPVNPNVFLIFSWGPLEATQIFWLIASNTSLIPSIGLSDFSDLLV